jgi:hypothetical protein
MWNTRLVVAGIVAGLAVSFLSYAFSLSWTSVSEGWQVDDGTILGAVVSLALLVPLGAAVGLWAALLAARVAATRPRWLYALIAAVVLAVGFGAPTLLPAWREGPELAGPGTVVVIILSAVAGIVLARVRSSRPR